MLHRHQVCEVCDVQFGDHGSYSRSAKWTEWTEWIVSPCFQLACQAKKSGLEWLEVSKCAPSICISSVSRQFHLVANLVLSCLHYCSTHTVSKNCKWPGPTNMKAAVACCPNGISKFSWCHLRSGNVLQFRKRVTRSFPLSRSTWTESAEIVFSPPTEPVWQGSVGWCWLFRVFPGKKTCENMTWQSTCPRENDTIVLRDFQLNRLRLRSEGFPNGPHELRNLHCL